MSLRNTKRGIEVAQEIPDIEKNSFEESTSFSSEFKENFPEK